MWETGTAVVEWLGINVLAAQIMAWLTANGALGMGIIVGLGVTLTFCAAVVAIHKLNSIPVSIPYAKVLVPIALVMAMLIFLGLMVMTGLMIWREGSQSPSSPPRPSAPFTVSSGTDGHPSVVDEPGGP